ncbi:MAG: DNA polymerase III subunit [Planctomycetota bacterium]
MLSSAIYSDGFIGHKKVVEKLSGLLEESRLPHALLFSGPDGVGKARVGRWLAAALLCPSHGCGTCSTCKRVLGGFHPDFHEVCADEGRREILIQQIRGLIEALFTKPFEASGKAALIDEADRMNEESQNAFLKSLEEPPDSTVLILVTSTPERLLPTILSRCQRIRFNRLSDEELDVFMAGQSDVIPDFSIRLAQGSPGRLVKFMQVDAGRARKLFLEFITSEKLPSPVKACTELMEWAQSGEGGNLKHPVRERIRLSLNLCAGLLRDLAMLKEGTRGCHILNQDIEHELEGAAGNYGLSGLFFAGQEVLEASADILGYVDPGLAAEKVFRVIREIRK